MLDLVDRALRFAAIAHDKGYRKNDNKTPYIYHPAMTGFILMRHGFDEELIAASILHDTVEDTDVNLEDINNLFGQRIHDLVKACTENKELSWEERKQAQLDGIRKYPLDVIYLKLADKLHNISDTYIDFQQHGASIFDQFNRGFDKQKWYYQGLLEAFASREELQTHPMYEEFKSKVELLYPDQ